MSPFTYICWTLIMFVMPEKLGQWDMHESWRSNINSTNTRVSYRGKSSHSVHQYDLGVKLEPARRLCKTVSKAIVIGFWGCLGCSRAVKSFGPECTLMDRGCALELFFSITQDSCVSFILKRKKGIRNPKTTKITSQHTPTHTSTTSPHILTK